MLDLDAINAELAEVADAMRTHWDEGRVDTRVAALGEWAQHNMPLIAKLTDQRRALLTQTGNDIGELALRLGWSESEKCHAIESLQDDGDAFGDECVIRSQSGRELRSPAYPDPCDYLRVTQNGFELAYWSVDEWGQDPQVLGAIMGSLKHGVPAPQAEDLTPERSVWRDRKEQRSAA